MEGIDIKEAMREKYADKLERAKERAAKPQSASSCCCCGPKNVEDETLNRLYAADSLAGLDPELLKTSFGCGNPCAIADLKPGETVLDLGSGAGLDTLISAKIVGPRGKAYGVDMTQDMLDTARANKEKAGIENAEFLYGEIDNLPLEDNTIDCIISNCVINLTPDKRDSFGEALRVLKPGGRIAISDMLLTKPLPKLLADSVDVWSCCISGALYVDECRDILAEVGFENISIEVTHEVDIAQSKNEVARELVAQLTEEERANLPGTAVSASIKGTKPLQ